MWSRNDLYSLNNMAITFFQQGNYDCAEQCLLTALAGVQHSFDDTCVTTSEHDVRQTNSSNCPNQWGVHWETIGNCAKHWEDSTGGPLLYSYAVTFSTNDDGDGQTQMLAASQHVIHAILLYNLALLNHWQSMYCKSSAMMRQALALYQQVADVISRHELLHNNDQNRDELDQMALAVLNNMGHICFQLCQFSQARQCFCCMRVQISTRIGSLSRLHGMNGYETFVLSAMLPVTELRFAPAA